MKKKKWIISIVILVIISIWTIFVVRINAMFPGEEELIYCENEDISLGEDVYLQVTNSSFLPDDIIKVVYSNEIENGQNIKSVVISLSLTNKGIKEKSVELYPMMLESGAFANACHLSALMAINEGNENRTLVPSLKAGENITIHMPFLLRDIHFQSNEWEHIEDRSYSLVFNLYPQKKSIKLSLSE